MSSDSKERILLALKQIESSILLLQDWNRNLEKVDDY